MITLDQVQQLEIKVSEAVDLINRLKAEKIVLEEKVDKYELRFLELEEQTEKLEKDQSEIEDKIIGAINQLDEIDTENNSADSKTKVAPETEEISAESSASEEQVIVETDELELDESVDYKETEDTVIEDHAEDTESDEVIEDVVSSEVSLPEEEEDNHSELHESFTEDPQVGLPMDETPTEETLDKGSNSADESANGEMVEDNSPKNDKSENDLFEQSLDIF